MKPERINRRELIVEAAAKLFIEQGYAATSVRQIAEAVGCTEAALYYHFKEGKRALFQAVVECRAPDFAGVLENCRKASSLSQLILEFGRNMLKNLETRERLVQWLISEYPNLSLEEKELLHRKHLNFHHELVALLLPFTPDEQAAKELGWMLLCSTFGYRQLFMTLDLYTSTDFSKDRFTERLAHYLSTGVVD